MKEKSYFEAMFGELSNSDGGNIFSLSTKDFISPPRLTQRNKEKIKEAYEKAHEIRKFEIDLYWKRATYFWAFELVALTGLGALFFKHAGKEGSTEIAGALALVSLGGTLITYLWMLVLLGSKSWQRNWEKHVDMLEYYFSGNLYKCMFLNGKNPFSSSAASRAIVSVFLFFWFICLIFSFNEFINLFDFSKNNRLSFYCLFILSLAIISGYTTHTLRGSPHMIQLSDFSLTIRRPETISTSNFDKQSSPAVPAVSRPCGAKPGSAQPQNFSSQHRRKPARRPQRPALLPRCQPSR